MVFFPSAGAASPTWPGRHHRGTFGVNVAGAPTSVVSNAAPLPGSIAAGVSINANAQRHQPGRGTITGTTASSIPPLVHCNQCGTITGTGGTAMFLHEQQYPDLANRLG